MNKNAIKTYAIWARNELIDRVSQKAYEYGVEKDNIVPSDAQSINGRLLSDSERIRRQSLIREINNKGYDQVIEEVAYTWFNRFIALRFMEVNNYLPNKVRLFTNENNEFKPQIIEEALHIELDGLDRNRIFELKEANNNEELYKELLLATCNDMHKYLPGMFRTIDDYMTLLFPNNLLREESVLGRLISDIDEDSWSDQVQIIGWLYQYYNTEPKDKTFADLKKNIKINKDTIPAVTQLFTPDWIVRYMTENSLGRLWLEGHPNDTLKSEWKYYLDETEQEPETQAQVAAIRKEYVVLKPEGIRVLDPCMGSGHILVYAFDVFMQIYVSEGWTEREAAVSILKNNLFGLDIDERAYQLSYFALMMKARQYNRRILSENITPNVMAIEESNTLRRDLLDRFGGLKSLATRLVDTFIDAKEYGSILNVEFTKEELDSLDLKLKELYTLSSYEDLLTQADIAELIEQFTPLLKQARIMAAKYDCVVTNPPYRGMTDCNKKLNDFVAKQYPISKTDLYSVFIERCKNFTKTACFVSMITMQSWMYLASFKDLRKSLIASTAFENMLIFGSNAFDSGDVGTVVQTVSFVFRTISVPKRNTIFVDLNAPTIPEDKRSLFFNNPPIYRVDPHKFTATANCQFMYDASKKMLYHFENAKPFSSYAVAKPGMQTSDNDRFLRFWEEVEFSKIGFGFSHEEAVESIYKWFPYNKGIGYRKWYGNNDYIVNFYHDGEELKYWLTHNPKDPSTTSWSRNLRNYSQYFKEGITFTAIGLSFSARLNGKGYLFDTKGPTMFGSHLAYLCGFVNSVVFDVYNRALCKQMTKSADSVNMVPVIIQQTESIETLVQDCVFQSKCDWDSFETSWDFVKHPLIRGLNTIKESYNVWDKECSDRFNQLKSNEEELNKIFIDIYGLQDELTPEVEDKDITVRKVDLTREIKSLISYAVGCMFGRYSLDTEGLAYAGGEWDGSKYRSYIPDTDNILPITDDEYFEDDIVSRFINFIKVTYGEDTLEENLKFISDALGEKGSPREVIRNYFLNDFFKDHCSTYQKRPIYWQFDSGKKNGFKALMYIHRYTPDLIARMRTSYIHELQSKYNSQISLLEGQINFATSTSDRVKLEKQLKKIKEQADELRVYEEKIHHYADMMMPMDLDDGVKANYAKFEELLTKIK